LPEPLTGLQILELILIGATAGVLGGMLGIGGGVVMIPGMAIFLGQRFGVESFHLYKLAAITTTIFLSLPAITRHLRAKALQWRLMLGILPFALLGVVLGVFLSTYLVDEQTRVLRRLFGGFLILAAGYNLYRATFGKPEREGEPVPSHRLGRIAVLGSVVGLPAGVLAGLLGIGGGVWAVPSQRLLLGVPTRNAIATSAATILPIAILTTILTAAAVNSETQLQALQGFQLAFWLVPTALGGAWLGAGLTHRLPVKALRLGFQVVLLVAGVRLLTA
jgi:hypothetical protein